VLATSLQARGRRAADDAARGREASVARAADAAYRAYAALLADPGRLAAYAVAATPVREVMELRIGSRPASRSAELRLEDLRAISWNFSWQQSRHGIPAWFGLGAALEALLASDGLDRSRRLYREWPFLRGLVDDARLALVHADMPVAERYAALAGDDARGLFEVVRAEHERAVRAVLALTGDATVLAPWPTIERTVARRNPYVDVLSHAQIELLARLRGAGGGERDAAREALLAAMNGIAAGLQTVG
jgi:phosphoenolpyruvate carboxylase